MDSDLLHINQWVTGADTDPVAVFLHGFMGSSMDWAFLSDQLSCTVLAVDLPGHGQSAALEGAHWIEATADQIAHQLQGLGIEKCHLVGYSLGGRVAMQLAIRYPNLFDRIVLESCHPGLENQAERDHRKSEISAGRSVFALIGLGFLKIGMNKMCLHQLLTHPT